MDTLLPTMFALPVAPDDFLAFRASLEAFHPVGFRAMASALAEDVSGALPGVEVPTLLVYGDNDPRTPGVAERMHSAIKASRLVVLEGAGHELPQQFNEACGLRSPSTETTAAGAPAAVVRTRCAAMEPKKTR